MIPCKYTRFQQSLNWFGLVGRSSTPHLFWGTYKPIDMNELNLITSYGKRAIFFRFILKHPEYFREYYIKQKKFNSNHKKTNAPITLHYTKVKFSLVNFPLCVAGKIILANPFTKMQPAHGNVKCFPHFPGPKSVCSTRVFLTPNVISQPYAFQSFPFLYVLSI